MKATGTERFPVRKAPYRRFPKLSVLGLSASVGLLLLVVGASGTASPFPWLPAASPTACGLLSGAVPPLASAPNAQLFPISTSSAITYYSGNPGVPEVYPSGTSGSGGGPNVTVGNVTFGAVRSAWNQTCGSATFLQVFQNVSPAANSLRQFWYDTGRQVSPNGTATHGTAVVEPGFLWDAGCTGNVSGSTIGSPYLLRPLMPPPAYSGSGCTYWEYWSMVLTSAGTTNLTGPYLLEAVTANFVPPGQTTQHPGGGPGLSSEELYLALAAPFVVAIGVVVAVRRWHRRSDGARPPTAPPPPTPK